MIIQYFGGKARICKDIVEIINSYKKDNQPFLSPFVGSGCVEQYISGDKILCDKHNYLIDMYKALQNGWKPPTELTKEEYDYIKNNRDEKSYLTGFVGFGCSFAGKWFGGYARNKRQRNYCLDAYNSIHKKINNGLLNAEFKCCDYKDLDVKGYIIYCDPPYQNTTQYDRNVVGQFNHDEFWDWVRKMSKDNVVLVSEYNAPIDFECIWEKSTRLDIRDKDNILQKRTEKLFKYKG